MRELEKLQQQLEKVEQQIVEADMVSEDIEKMKKVKKGTKAWVSLHNGIFVKAELVDTKNMMMNVGSNIIAIKSVDEAKKLIEKQKKELISYRDKISKTLYNSMIKENV